MIAADEIAFLRDLARQYAQVAADPIQDVRRDLWRRHNSLVRTRPLFICTGLFFWHEIGLYDGLKCTDPTLRLIEQDLKLRLYRSQLNDDWVFEPYVTMRPAFKAPPSHDYRWGAPIRHTGLTAEGGSFKFLPPLMDEGDIDKVIAYDHQIDEQATAEQVAKVQDAIGDIITVAPTRSPYYTGWFGDISTDVARLRGLEQIMWDMLDRPEWLHRLCGLMRDGVLRQHQQAEDAGDWRKIDAANQALPYCQELPDPVADGKPTPRKQLWVFMAAQEMAQVSPEMHDEFILQYQLPIMAKFGMVAYGCCEDLTKKIDMLRKVPNLRRISVTPWADVAKCAEQIREDYVFSWRPSPAETICNGFVADKTRRIIRDGLAKSKGCHVDVTLKDVQTVGGDFQNLVKWARIARECCEEAS